MRYTIDDENAARAFMDDSDVPFLYQPHWPDGTPWASKEEAEGWILAKIEELTNPDHTVVPGNNPSEPVLPRPVDHFKSAAEKLKAIGLTDEEIKAVRGF